MSRRLPPKAVAAVNLFNAGAPVDEIARRLELGSAATVNQYLTRARKAGHWVVPRSTAARGPRHKPRDGPERIVGVRLPADVFGAIEAEAIGRSQPLGTIVREIVAAAVDEGIVAALLNGEEFR